MRVLIVGGGGREHALAWKLSQSPLLSKLYCAPGNAGIAGLSECVQISPDESDRLAKWALEKKIDLTVVGPEAPLASGLADRFRSLGLTVFGPGRDGARLEGSKVWAKEKMRQYGIPTASFAVFSSYRDAHDYLENYGDRPVVVKADGLAAGKGVTVAAGRAEAVEALRLIMEERRFGDSGEQVVIEECLEGEEVSVLAITDGKKLLVMPSAQDHKAVGEGDSGPNTGGMGAYSPAPIFTTLLAEQTDREVFQPLLEGFAREGIDFRGIIYAGLMVREGNLSVLEFNVRFGDPEVQAIIPRLESDLLPLLLQAAEGDLSKAEARWKEEAAVCVVIASGGYPGSYRTGFPIEGIEEAEALGGGNVAVFHAGTALDNGSVVTAGGRVLGVTAWDMDLKKAVELAYRAVERISFENAYSRRDIAYRALK